MTKWDSSPTSPRIGNEAIRSAFEQSFRVVTALDRDRLVGAGRMLSDVLSERFDALWEDLDATYRNRARLVA